MSFPSTVFIDVGNCTDLNLYLSTADFIYKHYIYPYLPYIIMGSNIYTGVTGVNYDVESRGSDHNHNFSSVCQETANQTV